MAYGNSISISFATFCLAFVLSSPIRDVHLTNRDSHSEEIWDGFESFTVEYDRNSLILRLNFSCSSVLTGALTDNVKVEIYKESPYGLINYRRAMKLCTLAGASSCDQYLQSKQVWYLVENRPAQMLRGGGDFICKDNCQVEFHHIYAGRYSFKFTEYYNSTEVKVPIFAEYENDIEGESEPDVFTWNTLIDARTNPENGNVELEIVLDQQHVFQFELFHMDIYKLEKAKRDCYETLDPQNIHIDINGTVKRQSFSFANLSQGFYCLVIDPEDERCQFGNELDQTCTRHFIYEISEAAVSVREVVTGKNGTFSFTLAASIGLAVLLLIIFLTSHFCNRNDSLPPIGEEISYGLLGDGSKTWTAGCSVLLLYCERSSGLRQHVDHLKSHLKAYQVLDRADPGDESVDIEGIHWFSNRLSDPKTKVVVIRCPEMVRCEQLIRHGDADKDSYDLFAIYHLLEVISSLDPSTQYRRVFVVSFPDLPVGSDALFNLTPRRSYRLPDDLHHLLQDLGDS